MALAVDDGLIGTTVRSDAESEATEGCLGGTILTFTEQSWACKLSLEEAFARAAALALATRTANDASLVAAGSVTTRLGAGDRGLRLGAFELTGDVLGGRKEYFEIGRFLGITDNFADFSLGVSGLAGRRSNIGLAARASLCVPM